VAAIARALQSSGLSPAELRLAYTVGRLKRRHPSKRQPREPNRTPRVRRAGGRGARPAAALMTEFVSEATNYSGGDFVSGNAS